MKITDLELFQSEEVVQLERRQYYGEERAYVHPQKRTVRLSNRE